MSILIETFFNKENIILELGNLGIQEDEKNKILKVADELAEYRFLNAILEKLEEKDKELFMDILHGSTPEGLAEFLREKIKGIEEALQSHAKELEGEIIEDIRSLKES